MKFLTFIIVIALIVNIVISKSLLKNKRDFINNLENTNREDQNNLIRNKRGKIEKIYIKTEPLFISTYL